MDGSHPGASPAARPLPARIAVPSAELSFLPYLRALVRNPIQTWPRWVYEEPFLRARVFGRPLALICDPELIKLVLVDEAEAFVKPDEQRRVLAALGEGILTADGGKWRWQRRVAAPLFRPSEIEAFTGTMLRVSAATAARWRALPPGSTIGLAHEMMRLAFDIIVETLFSGSGAVDAARVETAITDYLDRAGWVLAFALARAPDWVPFPGRRRFIEAGKFLRAEVERGVRERRASAARRDDLIQRLLEASDPETGRRMDDAEITDNLLTFLTAGHETTALTMTWTLYLLSLHPEVEARVLAEIAEVTGGGPLASHHLGRLAYTRQVISEAMRLYPAVPIAVRRPVRDINLGGQHLEAGQAVLLPIYAIHRHRRLWEAPDEFRPERFDPAAVKARHRFAYLPFSAGPRVCIGMGFAMTETAAILATLLPAVRLRLKEGYSPTPEMRVTLRPEGGMPMWVEPR